MSKISTAVVFPGQGTQRPGMGEDFHGAFESSRRVFEEASEALALDVASLCFSDDERLGLTEYAQPAILVTEIAMLAAARSEFGLQVDVYGGHSLGEYTALVASGALGFPDAVRAVKERGRLMQDAVEPGRGRMVAIVGAGLNRSAIEGCLDGLDVAIANDNASNQIVLSGIAAGTHKAQKRITAKCSETPLRFIELEVSAPFHCSLMSVIEPEFAEVLSEIAPRMDAQSAAAVTSNVTGTYHQPDVEAVTANLVQQISGRVRWRDNMHALADSAERVIEIGPGRPLRGFFKTLGVSVSCINSARAIAKVLGGSER